MGALAVVAAVSGLIASLAFEPYGVWPLAFIAVAGVGWAVHRTRSARWAVLVGWCFGLTFMGTKLHWQTAIMLESYLGLTAVMSLMYAAVGGLLKVVQPLPGAIVWSAGVWSLGEWVLSVWPFGGFMWMRLGYSQIDGPLAGFYPFFGAAAVSFLVALVGHTFVDAVETPTMLVGVRTLAGVLAALCLGFAGSIWMPTVEQAGTVNVGWVQGGAPGGGIYGLGPARTITRNQTRETYALMDEVDAGRLPRPSFIVWPENSTDLDPRYDFQTHALVGSSVSRADAPVLVGAVYQGPSEGERQTVSVWWTKDGPQDVYVKQNIVPFGEWIPLRSLLLPLIPVLAYVGDQSVAGTEPGVLEETLPDGRTVKVGVAICFEVVYPQTLYEAEHAGADVFTVVSSNAMYQGTNQIDQQFAITRVRAAEMRRDILVVTTSGKSGRIGPHGEVVWSVSSHDPASGVEIMPIAHPVTPAMYLGPFPERLLVGLGLIALAAAAIRRVRADWRRSITLPILVSEAPH